jgi:amino acid transporter
MTARSLGTVVRDIGSNVDRLARAEFRLAVAELRGRLEALSDVTVLLVAAALAATLAAVFLLLGGMFALAHVMPLWLAAFVIALIPAAAAAALINHSRAHFAAGTPLLERGLTERVGEQT